MPTVTSADGTTIGYETTGTGPALIIVDGAMCYRGQGPALELAQVLADSFTVYCYDRRGRGESGDTLPWSAEREIEDLAALLAAAGGTAYLFGASSGAVLAADAANRLPGFVRLALYEPPFIVDDTHAPRPATFLAETEALIAAGDTGGAVKKFLRSVGMPGFAVQILALLPPFKKIKAAGHTLPYDLRILGDTGRGLPLEATRWSGVGVPAIVMDGGKSPTYMRHAAQAFADALPKAEYRTLPGQTHLVKASVVGPAAREFLLG
jgi:pimeloyl-ACP methyl ester carboxylesterase